ncbi:hypothetical protein VOLCADRAFT_88499 [Volvox carteri f. nagariensis]|uniref:Uncharacterized protein n=1 Tax=Volvox carteri f. nagariensis TaxID=3068 RepID=D8TP61_VOLCA|nr:uncharacterized protein VOLCADRAFT_88499 [Volvox carteri f. nagariensis]EFJ50705.1 hypothetical protein VOLCADRAFT_88499 [Volvox carteri f. nagariensis]|eukprot:XP_002948298.1 hypothetical protein VOLCADRAFT_88499 [Volvox carteri f. nagariensis]
MASHREQGVLGEWQSLYNEFLSAERAAESVQKSLAPDSKWHIPSPEPSMTDLSKPAEKQQPHKLPQQRPWAPMPGDLFGAVTEDCCTEEAVAVEEELLRRLKSRAPSPKSSGVVSLQDAHHQLPQSGNVVAHGYRPNPLTVGARPLSATHHHSTSQNLLLHQLPAQPGRRPASQLLSTASAAPYGPSEAGEAQGNGATHAFMPGAIAQPSPSSSRPHSPLRPTSQTEPHAYQPPHYQLQVTSASALRSAAPAAEADRSAFNPQYPAQHRPQAHLRQRPASAWPAPSAESSEPTHSTHVAYRKQPLTEASPSLLGYPRQMRSSPGRASMPSMPSPTLSSRRGSSPRSCSRSAGGRQQSGTTYVELHQKRQNSPPRSLEPRDELFDMLHRGMSPNRLRLLIKAVGMAAYERALQLSREALLSSPGRFRSGGGLGATSTEQLQRREPWSQQERQPPLSPGGAMPQKSRQAPSPAIHQQQTQARHRFQGQSLHSSPASSAFASSAAQQANLRRSEGKYGMRRRWEEDAVATRGTPIGALGNLRASAPAAAAPAQGVGREAAAGMSSRWADPASVGREKQHAEQATGPKGRGKRSPLRVAVGSRGSVSGARAGAVSDGGEVSLGPGRSSSSGGGSVHRQGTAAWRHPGEVLHAGAATLPSPELFISPQAYREYAARDQQQTCGGGDGAADGGPIDAPVDEGEDDGLTAFNVHGVRHVQQRLAANMDAAVRRSVVLPTPPFTALFRNNSVFGDNGRADARGLALAPRSRAATAAHPPPGTTLRRPNPSAHCVTDASGRSVGGGAAAAPPGAGQNTAARDGDPLNFEHPDETDTEFEHYDSLSGSRGGAVMATGPALPMSHLEWHVNPAYGMSAASSSGGGSAVMRSSWPITPARGEPVSEPSLASMLPVRHPGGITAVSILPTNTAVDTAAASAAAAALVSTPSSPSSETEPMSRSIESRAGAYAWPDEATSPHSNTSRSVVDAQWGDLGMDPYDPVGGFEGALPAPHVVSPNGGASGGASLRQADARGQSPHAARGYHHGQGGPEARVAPSTTAAAGGISGLGVAQTRSASSPRSLDAAAQTDASKSAVAHLDLVSITEQLSRMDLASLELIRGYASGYIDGRVQGLTHHGQIRSQVVKSAVLRLVDDVLQSKRDASSVLQALPPSSETAAAGMEAFGPDTAAVVAAAAIAVATAVSPAAPQFGGAEAAATAAAVAATTSSGFKGNDETVAGPPPPAPSRVNTGYRASVSAFHEELVAKMREVAGPGDEDAAKDEARLEEGQPQGEEPAASAQAGTPVSAPPSVPSVSGDGNGGSHVLAGAAPDPSIRRSDPGAAATTASAAAFVTIGDSIHSPGAGSAAASRRHLKCVSWQRNTVDDNDDDDDDDEEEEEKANSISPLPQATKPRMHTSHRMRLPSAPPVAIAGSAAPLFDREDAAAAAGGRVGAEAAAAVVSAPLKAEVCLELEDGSDEEDALELAGVLGGLHSKSHPPPSGSPRGTGTKPGPSHSAPIPSEPEPPPLSSSSAPDANGSGPLSALLFELTTTGGAPAGTGMTGASAATPALAAEAAQGDASQEHPPVPEPGANQLISPGAHEDRPTAAAVGWTSRASSTAGDGDNSTSRSLSGGGERLHRRPSLAQLVAAHLSEGSPGGGNGDGATHQDLSEVAGREPSQPQPGKPQTLQPPQLSLPPREMQAPQLTPEQIQIQHLREEIEQLKRQAFLAQQRPAPGLSPGGPSSGGAGHYGPSQAPHRTRARGEEEHAGVEEQYAEQATADEALGEHWGTATTTRSERRIHAIGSAAGASSPRGAAPGSVRRTASAIRAWPHVGNTHHVAQSSRLGSAEPSSALASPLRGRTVVLSKPAYAGVLTSPPLSPASSRPAKLQALSTSPPVNTSPGHGLHALRDHSPPGSSRSTTPTRKGAVAAAVSALPLSRHPDLDQALQNESMWFIQQLENAMARTGAAGKPGSPDGVPSTTQAAAGSLGVSGGGADKAASAATAVEDGTTSVGVGGSPRGDQLLKDLVARGMLRGKPPLLKELHEASLDELAAAVVGLLSGSSGNGGGGATGPAAAGLLPQQQVAADAVNDADEVPASDPAATQAAGEDHERTQDTQPTAPVPSSSAKLKAPPPSDEAEDDPPSPQRSSVLAKDTPAAAGALAASAAATVETADVEKPESPSLRRGGDDVASFSGFANSRVIHEVVAGGNTAHGLPALAGTPPPVAATACGTSAAGHGSGAASSAAIRTQNVEPEVGAVGQGGPVTQAVPLLVLSNSSNSVSSRTSSHSSCGGASLRRLLDPQAGMGTPPRGVAMAYLRRQPSTGVTSGPAAAGPNDPGSGAEVGMSDTNSVLDSRSTSMSQKRALKSEVGAPAAVGGPGTVIPRTDSFAQSAGRSAAAVTAGAGDTEPEAVVKAAGAGASGAASAGPASQPDSSKAATSPAADASSEPRAVAGNPASADTPVGSGGSTPSRGKSRDGKNIEPVLTELRGVRSTIAAEGDPDGTRTARMAELLDQLDGYRRGVERRHGPSHNLVSQLRTLHADMSKWLRANTGANAAASAVATTPSSTAKRQRPKAATAAADGSAPSVQTEITAQEHGSPERIGRAGPNGAPAGVGSPAVASAHLRLAQTDKPLQTIARESLSSVNTDATFDLVAPSAGGTPRDSTVALTTETFAFPLQRQLAPQQQHPGARNVAAAVPAGNDTESVSLAPPALPGASAFVSASPGQSLLAEGINGDAAAPGGMSLMDLANRLNNMTIKQHQQAYGGPTASAAAGSASGHATAPAAAAAFLPGPRGGMGAVAALPPHSTGETAHKGGAESLPIHAAQTQAHTRVMALGSGPSTASLAAEAPAKATNGGEAPSKKEALKHKSKSKWGLLFGVGKK